MPDLNSTTNLIINNIPSSISDDLLNKLFLKFGPIKSCKIIRINEKDEKTFGFCEYTEPKSAKNALIQLDGYKLQDRVLKVSYAKLFPKPKGKCIEVTNLPKSTHEESVRKYFSQFGRIARCRLLSNDSINTKTAEIVFDNKTDADKASQKSTIKWSFDNGKQTVSVDVNLSISERPFIRHDQPMVVKQCQQSQLGDNYFLIQPQPQTPQQRTQTTAFTTPFDLSQLQGVIGTYGPLGSIYQNALQFSSFNGGGGGGAFYPGQNYANFGFPLINYSPIIDSLDKSIQNHSLSTINHGTAVPYSILYPPYGAFINTNNNNTNTNINNNALSVGIPFVYTSPIAPATNNFHSKSIAIDNVSVDDKKKDLYYSRQSPKINNTNNNNNWVVYVYNIGNSTNGDQLRTLFADKYDKDIVRVDVPKDLQNGSNKNFGFITFKSYSTAQLAIDEMNGKDFQGKFLQVSFKK